MKYFEVTNLTLLEIYEEENKDLFRISKRILINLAKNNFEIPKECIYTHHNVPNF